MKHVIAIVLGMLWIGGFVANLNGEHAIAALFWAGPAGWAFGTSIGDAIFG